MVVAYTVEVLTEKEELEDLSFRGTADRSIRILMGGGVGN